MNDGINKVLNKIADIFDDMSLGIMEDVDNGDGGILTNIFNSILGIKDAKDYKNPIITAFMASLQELDEFDEALETFVLHIVEVLNTFFEMEDSESPSMLFFRYVDGWLLGIMTALTDEEKLTLLNEAITAFGEMILTYLDNCNLPEAFEEVGRSCAEGMAEGIRAGIDDAVAAAIELCDAVQAATTSRKGLDINSPSKVMRKIAKSIPEGMVLGIQDGAQNVYDAAASLANDGVDGVESGFGRIQDLLDTSMDLNPVITPLLDLSMVRTQMDELNSLMTARSIGISGQNGGTFGTDSSAQQINFTQNNYSPKALSRIDIYRQTKNQISMMKGVVANA